MKKLSWLLVPAALFLTFSLSLQSCRKINEATELGGDLIPAVDHINTFETFLDVETDNSIWNGSTNVQLNDNVALGALNDPEFGSTKADVYFNYGPALYGTSNFPFYNKDSIQGFDSVVVSLAYAGFYGDTIQNLSVRVFETQPGAVKDSVMYTTQEPDFALGNQLGSATFQIKDLNDSMTLIRRRDTTKVGNVLRIRLNNISAFTNSLTDTNHYRSYSEFYSAHPALAIKADQTGNGLAYFSLLDSTRTKVQVYYRVQRNGVIDTTVASFYQGFLGAGTVATADTAAAKPRGTVANLIHRTPGGNWLTYLNPAGTSEDKAYVQSEPGSAIYLRIPGLDTMQNKLVHRAELVASVLPSANNDVLTPMPSLYLGRRSGDSILQIRDDSLSAVLTSSGAVNTSIFGGNLRSDNTYRFGLTLYVQQILLRQAANDQLKLFAPRRVRVADGRLGATGRTIIQLPQIAYGRVVLGGGTYADPNKRMRLRIIYSKLP